MSNLNDSANHRLTDSEPTGADGGLNGPPLDGSTQGAAGSLPETGKFVPIDSSALPQATQAHLRGIPDTLPLTWCAHCNAEVLPKGKGTCPRCARFLKGSFSARKHPVNLLRRDALLAKFVRDYQPDTQRLQSMCEQYAGVVEQLEALKPGSPEHQRLVQLSQQLGSALEEARSREMRPQTDLDVLDDEELIARTTAILRGLLEVRDQNEARLHPIAEPATRPPQTDADAEPSGVRSEVTPSAPESICIYGCGTKCEEIKSKRPEIWRLFHHLDPVEVARRREEANVVMWRGLGWPARTRSEPEPEMTEEQQRQAALRSKLGWDSGTRRV